MKPLHQLYMYQLVTDAQNYYHKNKPAVKVLQDTQGPSTKRAEAVEVPTNYQKGVLLSTTKFNTLH